MGADVLHQHSGLLLTKTGYVIEWWDEFNKDLFNLTIMSYTEEAEARHSKGDSSITQKMVGEVLYGKVPGVDNISPKHLKYLDMQKLSWLTCL